MPKRTRVILTLLLSLLIIVAAAWVLSLEGGWY